MHIIPCNERLDEIIHFVARLNSDAAHHIGFFGEGEADVRASLAECLIPPSEGFLLAYEDDRLVGVFGVDADPEVDRAWLYGPLVDHADWHTLAGKLYAEVLTRIPASIHDRDLFCDEKNIHLQEFASWHGFTLRSENAVLTLMSEKYMPTARNESRIIPFDEKFFGQFESLHKTIFPNAYFTARQMVEKINETHRLFLAVEEGTVLGYNFCKIDPSAKSGYVDFIGTDESARGHGIGADLLAAGMDWMLSAPTTKRVSLTVNADNAAARRLYEKIGFATDRIMRGYRKRVGL